MILALSLALAAQIVQPPGPLPETEEGRAAQCQASVRQNAQAALGIANRWQAAGGGLHARQCVGLAYVALEQWSSAATVLEQAAQEAERLRDARLPDFWVQAGNAWLAGAEPARAIAAFDRALAAQGSMTPQMRGEVRLDRARALVAQNQLSGARADLNQALELVPEDPMAWYLSAALARRQGDLARARTDISRARELARDNPDILLLAGTIAGQAGDMAEAERIYRQVAQSAPNSDAGRAAQASLGTARNVEVAAPAASPTPPPPAPRQR
jgi:tetratricopeptide (TPR) repeat protein